MEREIESKLGLGTAVVPGGPKEFRPPIAKAPSASYCSAQRMEATCSLFPPGECAWPVRLLRPAVFPPVLPRHQVLRISAADVAQVQKVMELEQLEHLQVRGWGKAPVCLSGQLGPP